MKKKIFFAIVLIILVISEISVVYADLMITEHYFNNDGYVENDYAENDDVEKIGPFLEMVGSPLKEITALVTILSYVLGMVIISFNFGNDKNNNENNNSKNIFQKIYCGMSFVLNLLQIQILRNALIFYSNFTGVRSMSGFREEKINYMIIPLFYIVYVIIMTLLSIWGIKKKKEKAMCITITIITILLFIICAVIVYKTSAGYYTYDDI